MKVSHRARAAGFATIALLIGFGTACTTGGGGHGHGGGGPTPVKIYDSNPSPLPGGVPSWGFQCCQTSELGDEVTFAGSARKLTSATVTLANWAIESKYSTDGYNDPTGWNQLLTLNIYAVGPDDAHGNPTAGALLGSQPQVFHIPWRPAPDSGNCPTKDAPGYDYKWQSTPGAQDTNCFNSQADQVTFDLSGLNISAPGTVVWGVAFDTQTYGSPVPTGEGPYNSLNVGATGVAPTVGADADPGVPWLRSKGYGYCDGDPGHPAYPYIFRPNVGCASNPIWHSPDITTPDISFSATT
jgi:hypothetical protein